MSDYNESERFKMLRIGLVLLAIAVIVADGIVITGCGGKNSVGSQGKRTVVGTWTADLGGSTSKLTLNADGTGECDGAAFHWKETSNGFTARDMTLRTQLGTASDQIATGELSTNGDRLLVSGEAGTLTTEYRRF